MRIIKNIATLLIIFMLLFGALGAIYYFARGDLIIEGEDYSIFSIEGKSLDKEIYLIPNEECKISVNSKSDIKATILINSDIAKTFNFVVGVETHNLNELSDAAAQDLFDLNLKESIISIKSDFNIKAAVAQSFGVTENNVKFISDIDLSKRYFLLNIKVGQKRYVFYLSQYITVNEIKFSDSYPAFVLEGK